MDIQLRKISFIGLFLVGLTTSLWAQGKHEAQGAKEMERYAFADAIKIYELEADKGYESIAMYKNLGDSYYFNGAFSGAHKWYSNMFDLMKSQGETEIGSEYYYRYAQTLKSLGYYDAANEALKIFSKIECEDARARMFLEQQDYLKDIEENSGRYQIKTIDINSPYSDYGATIYNDELVFTSARDTGGVSKRVHSWTGDGFTSLYSVSLDAEGKSGKVKRFAKEINTKFNESSAVFSADGKTMYFTANNFNHGKRGRNSEGTTLLKLYKASLVDGGWKEVEELPFNSDEFSTAHPALTSDGKWLYFSSDRLHGFGQSDLYKVAILPNGGYGEPINLGESINTEGRESFPFISTDNELYFSTDGRPGLGGLDIYVTQIKEDGSFSAVKNIGAPANTSSDDFAYYIDTTTRKGFLSSNRGYGMGKDDIFSFLETRKLNLDCTQNIVGKVYEKQTQRALSHTAVTLFDGSFNELVSVKTGDDGVYSFKDLSCGRRYRVRATLADYNTVEYTLDLPKQSGSMELDFGLEKTVVQVKKGDDLFKSMKLSPIYFDFDKSHIRSDAQVELAKVVEVLREYPEMKIEVSSYTDSRGNAKYNLELSHRRAKATVLWIVSQGIDPKRVSGKGYGETRLLNGCSKGTLCSKKEHQENRRSEFKVIDL